jgi:NADP-dependent 3-hydroxy acid dehydrogenase YdfG
MKNKSIVIVTGVGMKEATKFFKKPNPATLISHNGKKYKMNAAAGAAVAANRAGYLVYMVGYKQEFLEAIGKSLMKKPYYCHELNLFDKPRIKKFVEEIKVLKKKTRLDVHLVHYGGASDTKVKLPGNTVFLDPWSVPSEAVEPIVGNAVTTWYNIIQALRSVFEKQKMTKVILISAITALRTKRLHSLDALQKGAVHALARSLAIDFVKENIFITEIMPGMTDTGFYDNQATLDAVFVSSKELGYSYNEDTFPVFSAERAGEAVVFALDVNAHVRELSLMPYGQYPHLGA